MVTECRHGKQLTYEKSDVFLFEYRTLFFLRKYAKKFTISEQISLKCSGRNRFFFKNHNEKFKSRWKVHFQHISQKKQCSILMRKKVITDFIASHAAFGWIRFVSAWSRTQPRQSQTLRMVQTELVVLRFDGTENNDAITELPFAQQGDNVTLKWSQIKKVEGYIVQPILPQLYPRVDPIKTTYTKVTVDQLVPWGSI